MTEKRFKLFTGNNYGVQSVDGEVFIDSIVSIGDADVLVDLLNDLTEKNEQLKQFPVKLENRIQKLQEDLQKLTEMDKNDLNPQAIEDVATVISISLNALMEFQKELME